MPEPTYPEKPFPLRARLEPPRAVRRAAEFFRLLLARPVSGGRARPMVSAGAAWAQLLTKGGERLEAWHRKEVLEFLRLWSGAGGDDVALSRARTSQDPGSSGGPGGTGRSGSPPARERTPTWLAGEEPPARLDRLAALAGAVPADATADTTQPFPTAARTGGWRIVRNDLTPAERARLSSGHPRPLALWPLVQGGEDDRGVEWFRPVRRRAHPGHPGPATVRAVDFPALSSAEALLRGTAGMKAYSGGRDHPEAGRGRGPQWGESISARPAAEARQGTRTVALRARPFADTPGDADSAPSWPSQAAQSLGRPLGVIPRIILERSFPDLNLSQVRIHTDAPADAAARELGADAFILGPGLFFRSGMFSPLTARGLALLTHELVHLRQIEAGPAPTAPSHRDWLEREAREIEGALLRPAALPGPVRSPHTDSRGRPSPRAFPALPLDLPRPATLPPARERGVGSHPQRLASLALERRAGSRPLTAEAGRIVPPEPGQSAGFAGAAPAPEDQDGPSRHFFRALERKIGIEKERRGIDRWVL